MIKKIICGILCLIMCANISFAFYEDLPSKEELALVETLASTTVPKVNSKSAILYDATYDRILYEKNSKDQRAMASTTKMITALVAIKYGNLNDVVTVSKKSASTGGSSINLKAGDKITLDDLIKGLLVHSGNDSAIAIAEHIAGSEIEFVNMMNEEAEEIGARDTHFMCPHGLDKEGHYSTAFDLLLISKKLLEVEYLANIVSCKTIPITINGYTKNIGTTNEMLSLYEGADGVKTGFTSDAGRCIITSASKNDRKLISVVLGADTKKMRTQDSISLLNYGFNAYKVYDLSEKLRKNIYIKIEKSMGGTYILSQDVKLKYVLKPEEIDDIEVKYYTQKGLVAPIYQGEIVAKADVLLDGAQIATAQYKLPQTIERKTWKQYFREFMMKSEK